MRYNHTVELWIPITLFASVMQVARTGCQRSLKATLDDETITWLRFGFALPLAPLYLLLLPGDIPTPNWHFFGYAAVAGVLQVTATLMMVRLFSRRNFAVCTAFTKTEAVQIAIFGTLFFGLPLSLVGIIGVSLGAASVLLLLPRDGDTRTVTSGIIIGGGFALTALCIQKAVKALPDADPFAAAALTLFVMLLLQTILSGALLLSRRPLPVAAIWRVRWRAVAVGVCGFLGSIGWASAFALTHPALVKTLSQVELPLAYLLARTAFAEKPRPAEIAGMLVCIVAASFVAFA